MRVVWIGMLVAGLAIAGQSPAAAQINGGAEKQPDPKVKKQLTTQTVADAYACPMHPDVVSTKAGKCAKCGMALEKKQQKPVTVPKERRASQDKAHKEKCGGCLEPCDER